ncbi:Bacteriophage protein [Mycobacteroides abscessus subsp. bolletii]|nr:Bacteriophage protein [Mycobacteroides abscessus subsp. bolletii]SHS47612.1 Bacteriophage protein [Mycobacteroides abscessus subsp. bolletii]SHT07289.1 Bacteriophage protein [Mycobacteroides abscessus subsp. bolletii]SHT14718.1 Bacteriophage protein [Mycobacteroides abscessus subsp. bolletii]SHY50577.1 Bacteriophage protein [Mycobacteroides abscessus subsp. bolletii]
MAVRYLVVVLMAVLRANVEFAKRIFQDRVGNDYVYGGNWNPFNLKVGTDCSGLVIDVCDAVRNGTAMAWTRHGMSTESWRPIEVGQTGTIFNTICVASPNEFPADAAVKIAIHHGPGGGANSHMWCEVEGIRMESNGSDGCVTGNQARSVYDTSYANDWHYLPGPITGQVGVDPAEVLARATGLSAPRAAEILPAVSDGLKASQCTNVNRIAMWLAQVGHESVSFKYTEEIAKGGRYAPYIGRTWIQITWDYNYRAFSEWCFERGLVPTRDYFVVNYRELADLKWAGLGASWYWTEQRPMNALTDAGDSATWKAGSITYRGFEAVTAAINGGTYGLADRRDRYNRALLQGEALLQLLNQEEDDMFTDDDRNLLRQVAGVRRPSLSPLRHLDEGDVNTCAGFAWTGDGLTHPQFVAMAAKYGHMDSIRLLGEVAGADPVKYPDRQEDAALAKAILADVYAANPAALQRFVAQNGA